MPSITRHPVETPWGTCLLDRSDEGLVRLRLPEGPARNDAPAGPTEIPDDVRGWTGLLRAYFAGERVDFGEIPLDCSRLSAPEAAIYAALRHVGYGQTTSYGDLAEKAGQPGAARAVGTAMARNPWPVVVPCHRVLAKGGALGGFSAPGGVDTKRRLLALEGIALDGGAPLLPGLFDGL